MDYSWLINAAYWSFSAFHLYLNWYSIFATPASENGLHNRANLYHEILNFIPNESWDDLNAIF